MRRLSSCCEASSVSFQSFQGRESSSLHNTKGRGIQTSQTASPSQTSVTPILPGGACAKVLTSSPGHCQGEHRSGLQTPLRGDCHTASTPACPGDDRNLLSPFLPLFKNHKESKQTWTHSYILSLLFSPLKRAEKQASRHHLPPIPYKRSSALPSGCQVQGTEAGTDNLCSPSSVTMSMTLKLQPYFCLLP